MAVNEVIINGETVLSLAGDTVSANNLLEGATAHNAKGEPVTGAAKIPTKTSELINDSGFVSRKSGVPYNVIAVPGANSAVLVWEKVTGAAKYRIQRINNGAWETIATPTANSYRATELTAGTEYAYRVLASMDGTTWGSASEAAYVTPFSVVSTTSISGISETPSDEFEGETATI